MLLRHASATHVGLRRDNNEDRLLAQVELFAVADGMGGHADGEIAAQIAIDTLRRRARNAIRVKHFDPKAFYERSFHQANEAIHEYGRAHPSSLGMGTTLTALHVREVSMSGEPVGPYALIGHAGDSRCYLIRGDDSRQITNDHGRGNVLLNCLGGRPGWFKNVDIYAVKLVPGDMLVLATDGLNYGCKTATAIARMRGTLSPKQFAETLISCALDGGGGDNVTVVVVEVV